MKFEGEISSNGQILGTAIATIPETPKQIMVKKLLDTIQSCLGSVGKHVNTFTVDDETRQKIRETITNYLSDLKHDSSVVSVWTNKSYKLLGRRPRVVFIDMEGKTHPWRCFRSRRLAHLEAKKRIDPNMIWGDFILRVPRKIKVTI